MTKFKIKYRYRLLLYFLLLLVFVALAFTVWISKQNRSYSISSLQKELSNYNIDIYKQLSNGTSPENITKNNRIDFTILDSLGYVIYDSREREESYQDNQIKNTEILQAKIQGEGNALRTSFTNNEEELLFHAKLYDKNYFIKTYSVLSAQEPLQLEKNNKYFLLIALLLIALILTSLIISKKLSKPLKSYLQLTHAIKNNNDLSDIEFGNDDYGSVGKEIANIFKQLEVAKKYKQQISHNIAHELKTPVTAIKAYLETIINTPDIEEEKKKEFLEKVYSQTLRLSHLINEVSTLNKLDEANILKNEQPFYKVERVNILSCIKDVIQAIEIKLKTNNITLDYTIDEDIDINGCYSLLYSLFKNLIDNTIEHGGKGCKIFICANRNENNGSCIEFIYKDTGKGVPKETLNMIFERFYRVDEGRSRKTGGSGLGLAIVKNAVAFHKGEIRAINGNEGGIIFEFFIYSL